jgi:hemoglobin-like flavoprotein
MDSKLLVGLIKEVVKSEVKQQVKEELAKLIKSGAVTLNSQRKPSTPSLREMTEVAPTPVRKQQPIQQQRPQQMKEYTSNPMLNEVLNMTQPFTAEQRKEGASAVGSVLDMIKPELRVDESEWETMDFRDIDLPSNVPTFESTGDALQDATLKALTRDYSALTKVFTKQEQNKKGR